MFDSRKKEWYISLQKLMEEESVFTSPVLCRKSLASMLGTNERYLHIMLKEYTGLPYSEYILALRLEYACRLLINRDKRQTVEMVASRSGFSSRKTFYRQFRKHYSVSPARFVSRAKKRE